MLTSPLLGPNGRPIVHDADEMTNRVGWNPLRGLTLNRVLYLLEAAETGYLADLTWLYQYIERREPITTTLAERRDAALTKCRWAIVREEEVVKRVNGDPVLADEQVAFLNEVFGKIGNLNEAWRWLGSAAFRGFAHLEKHYDASGAVEHLQPVPQWFFGLMFPRHHYCYNESAQNSTRGHPIEEAHWIVRECERHIDELAAIYYVGRNMTWKDWSLYVSRHGVPNIFLEVAKEAAATDADYARMATTLRQFVSAGKGVLPPGVKPTLFGGGSSAENTPFPGYMDYIDRMLVMRGTGGKLTMLSEPTGIGQGATDAHEAVFDEIASAEATAIAEILHKDIGEPALTDAFPGLPQLARFSIARPMSANVRETAEGLLALKRAGWSVSRAKAVEMLGFEVEPSEPDLGPQPTEWFPGMMQARAGTEPDENEDDLEGRVVDSVMLDTREAIQAALRVFADESKAPTDEELKELLDRLPEFLRLANKRTAGQLSLERMMEEAFRKGVEAQ
jgi:phage gp29-like protein